MIMFSVSLFSLSLFSVSLFSLSLFSLSLFSLSLFSFFLDCYAITDSSQIKLYPTDSDIDDKTTTEEDENGSRDGSDAIDFNLYTAWNAGSQPFDKAMFGIYYFP